MSAEGSPHRDSSLLAWPLRWATRGVLRYPKGTIVGSLVLAALSILLTVQFMGFKTSRLDLLNPHNSFNQRWLAYLEEFGDQDDAVILVEGAGREQVTPVLDDLAAELAREPKLFENVLHKRDFSVIRSKGLYLFPEDDLARLSGMVAEAEPITSVEWEQLSLSRGLQTAALALASSNMPRGAHKPGARKPEALAKEDLANQSAARLTQVLTQLDAALADEPTTSRSDAPFDELKTRLRDLETDYLLSNEGRFGFVLLNLPVDQSQFAGGSLGIDRLREIISQVQATHPETRIGLTGMPILENDEMRASQSDMTQATLLSLIGVAVLFLAGFGGWRHSVFAVLTLLISMAWSFGFVTLAIGHLNILSSAFAIILIGLGIDFCIHYVARYLQLRQTVGDSASAIEETAVSVGPGIITGGVTTAVAFGTTALTDFVGVAELGIVAAGGLLLCIAGALVVLPAMIHLSDRKRPGQAVPPSLPFEWLLRPVLRFPKTTLAISAIVVLVVGAGAVRLRYDHNLLNLQPTRIESVEVEKRLHNECDRSVFFAVSMAGSRQELRDLKARFEQLETVERTEELGSLVPESSPVKRQQIGEIAARLASLPTEVPELDAPDVAALSGALAQMAALLPAGTPPHEQAKGVLARLARLTPDEAAERLKSHERASAVALLGQLRFLVSLAEVEPPTLADLPAPLAARFVGKTKKHLLRVYASGNVWDMHKLEAFVRDVESVDPAVTGHPVQTYYASRQMQRSYTHAALYSAVAVAIVVMLDFRSVRYSLLSLIPMGLGLLLMFGILGYLDIPLNPANMIALPLILGIGIDDGVHLVHEYLRQKGRFRLTSSTATAVLLTSLTTMVGFGVMVFARHQGIRSLGQALTIGVFTCLATSILTLPALLALMSRNRKDEPVGTPAADTTEPSAEPSDNEPAFEPVAASSPEPTSATLRTSRMLARRRRMRG